ncbi:exocyst complex component EXO70B1-like [Miscanthus floridulus]|uniref:exocyst complex component EXO70B1-like n=1 Tax=Miscanthus floridulus TaxID=154761 RepID=UPI00345AA380
MERVSPEDAGQERVMAAAKLILKSLAVSKNDADDMMHFLSTFDPRLHPLSSPETVEEEASGGDDDQEELEEEIAAAEEVILRGNSSSPSSGGMIADYLYAVDDAMLRLEEEARSLLSSSSPSLRRLSLSSDDLGDATPDVFPRHGTLSPTALASVGAVAARMLRAGYGPKLAQVYVAAHRDALAESVALLGVEVVAIEEVLRMEWSALNQRMRRWSHAVRAVVRTFLADERRLCDEVFASDEDLSNECFADVTRGCVLQLLAFADGVAVSPRATEKLYRTLGMYEALADVQRELEALFADDAVRHTIEEFSHAIHGEASRKPLHGGEIHPMTRYVLNYCGLLTDCRGTLDAVLGDTGPDDRAATADDGAPASTLSARCIRELLTLLLRNINDKSQLYDDAGLQNIFLMNNLYYVVQKVRESPPLRELVGDDWLRRHRGQIRQYETGYLWASWTAVLSQLRRDDGASTSPAAGHRAPPGQSSWLQRRSAEWPWSPWVREQARGRAATAGVRGGARAAAAATQADRRRSTSVERVRGGVPAPDACTCMRVCGVPEVSRRLKNWNKAVWARNASLTKIMDPKTHFQS